MNSDDLKEFIDIIEIGKQSKYIKKIYHKDDILCFWYLDNNMQLYYISDDLWNILLSFDDLDDFKYHYLCGMVCFNYHIFNDKFIQEV